MFWRKKKSNANNETSRREVEKIEIKNDSDEFAQGCWPRELFERIMSNKKHDVDIIHVGKITESSNNFFWKIDENGPFEINSSIEFDDVIYLSSNGKYPVISQILKGNRDRLERKGELIATADHHVGYFQLNGKLPSYEIMGFFNRHYSQFFQDSYNYNYNHNKKEVRSSPFYGRIPCVDIIVFGCYWEKFCHTAFDAVRHMRLLNGMATIRFFTEEPWNWKFEDFSHAKDYTDASKPIDRFMIREDYNSVELYLNALGKKDPDW